MQLPELSGGALFDVMIEELKTRHRFPSVVEEEEVPATPAEARIHDIVED